MTTIIINHCNDKKTYILLGESNGIEKIIESQYGFSLNPLVHAESPSKDDGSSRDIPPPLLHGEPSGIFSKKVVDFDPVDEEEESLDGGME